MAQRPCIGLSWPLLRHLLELRNLLSLGCKKFTRALNPLYPELDGRGPKGKCEQTGHLKCNHELWNANCREIIHLHYFSKLSDNPRFQMRPTKSGCFNMVANKLQEIFPNWCFWQWLWPGRIKQSPYLTASTHLKKNHLRTDTFFNLPDLLNHRDLADLFKNSSK